MVLKGGRDISSGLLYERALFIHSKTFFFYSRMSGLLDTTEQAKFVSFRYTIRTRSPDLSSERTTISFNKCTSVNGVATCNGDVCRPLLFSIYF